MKSITFALLLLLATGNSFAVSVAVAPGDGVEFSQVDYPYDSPRLNSETGLILVDLPTLRSAAGMDSGFLNVNSAGGWVVRNLPVFGPLDYPYPQISTIFDLHVTAGTDVTSDLFEVLMSDTPWMPSRRAARPSLLLSATQPSG